MFRRSSNPPDIRFLKLDNSKMYFPTPEHFHDTSLPQAFSLPKPIMKYIWENPSKPEVYQKLIKTSKLFFLKNPIFVLKNLDYLYTNVFVDGIQYDGWECCNGDKCARRYECKHKREKIDMKKLEGKNIWVSKRLHINYITEEYDRNTIVSRFIPRIYRYDVQDLSISNQNISLDDLKFLGTRVRECRLAFITVYYDITLPHKDWEVVPFEDVIKVFSGAKSLFISYFYDNDNSACKSYDDFIAACSNIEKIELDKIPEIFDVPDFYQHLKRSKCRTLFNISPSDFDPRLNVLVDEVLATDSFEFIPPVFKYFKQNAAKLAKMKEIQGNEAAYKFFSASIFEN